MADCDTGRDIQTLGKHGDFVGFPIMIRILKNFDPVPAFASRNSRILKAFCDPDPTGIVKRHGHRINDHWFSHNALNHKPRWDLHLGDGLSRRQGRAGRSVLSVRD